MGSSRFPGKPLVPSLGRPMLQWVYEGTRASRLVSDVIVATCDEEIAVAARRFGARVAMTSPRHERASDRVAEAALTLDADVVVTYRPYPGAADPLAEWIASGPSSAVKVNATDRFEDVLLDRDLAVVATSSPTIWAEVLALDVPMILYCDPEQTLLTADFMTDLEQACRWCRSGDALMAEVERLAAGGWQYVNELKRIDTAEFIRTYVLHRGHCSGTVAEFLNDVCRHTRSVSAWEGSVYAAPAQSA